MGAFIGILGLLGILVAVIMLIVKAAFKKGWEYKKTGILAAVAVVLFIVGIAITPPSQKQQAAKGDSAAPATTQEQNNEENQAQPPEPDEQVTQDQQNGSGENQAQKDEANSPEIKTPIAGEKVLVEGAGERLMKITDGHLNFSDVVNIEVYQQNDEVLGSKTWAEVRTLYIKDWDDDGWCEEKAKLVILQAFVNDVIYLDEARVYNADGLQIASMRNWLPKDDQ